MSPAFPVGYNLSATTGPGVNPGLPLLPSHWNNPLPDNLRELDGRKIYLESSKHNLKLEMHPHGVRGVNAFTEYCVLSVLILNISSLKPGTSESTSSNLAGWIQHPEDQKRKIWENGTSKHILQGNATGLYLCMDDRSVVYQSANFSSSYCVFDHEVGTELEDNKFTERYFRQVNSTMPKWYLGLNRDGSVRCGNVTRKRQNAANFIKVPYGKSAISEKKSPPFEETKKECCKNNSCKKNRRRPGKNKRCHKWCRKHRRRFFTLKLKDLRRYYNRCVKKIRHCTHKKKGNVNR